jgi:hypothetical protein
MENQIVYPPSIINAQVPQQTKSYVPVSHLELIEFVKERLDKANLKICHEKYEGNKQGNQLFGAISVTAPSDSTELRMSIGFRNSYDKSMPVGFVAGAQVIVCSNLMFSGDVVQTRKHTANINRDLGDTLEVAMQKIESTFNQIEEDTILFKGRELSMERAHQAFGELLLNGKGIVSTNQVLAAAQLFNEPIHGFGNETVWGFYNAFTEALKSSHPYHAAKQYLNLHEYVKGIN